MSEPDDSNSKEYIETFKLNGRYKAHKADVLDLVSKQVRYTPDKISQMAELLSIDEKQLSEDIMGSILTEGELNKKPKTKLLRDIYDVPS